MDTHRAIQFFNRFGRLAPSRHVTILERKKVPHVVLLIIKADYVVMGRVASKARVHERAALVEQAEGHLIA